MTYNSAWNWILIPLGIGLGWLLGGTMVAGGLVVAFLLSALVYQVLNTNWSTVTP